MPLLPVPVEEIGGMKLLPLDGPLMLMPPPAGGGATPGATPAGMTWDATPKLAGVATPTPKKQRSQWDETPGTMGSATPMQGTAMPSVFTPGIRRH